MTERFERAHNVLQQPTERGPSRDGKAETPLHIAMLAPPWIPVPPPGYGGIEFVVALLCDALVERGHDVELFCAPGSSSQARVRPLLGAPHPESIERALFEADHVARAFAAIDEAAEGADPFHVVHDHSGYTALAMADRLGTPLITPSTGPSTTTPRRTTPVTARRDTRCASAGRSAAWRPRAPA